MSDYKLVPVEMVRELVKEAHYEGQASATGRDPSLFRWANSQARRNVDAMIADAPDVQGETPVEKVPEGRLRLGVGDGSGNLFVYGEYEAIKACQKRIIASEQARASLCPLALQEGDA